ncbi:MAG: carboxypeptidase-like regulatory domain-containing protein, partial [Flavobacteriales bacterium]
MTLKQKATYLMTLGFFLLGLNLTAQTDSTTVTQEVVQVSGLVVTGDSLMPLPFATVFRIRDSRGTMTDARGFFSIPVLEGDTIRFSSTGYIPRDVIIPNGGYKNRLS